METELNESSFYDSDDDEITVNFGNQHIEVQQKNKMYNKNG